MRNILRSLLCIAVPGAVVSWAEAGEPNGHSIVDNVVLDLSTTADGVTACLSTVQGAKLSGPYGVAVTALSAPAAWDETLPKTVAVEADYFTLPLRIDLEAARRCRRIRRRPVRGRRMPAPRHVHSSRTRGRHGKDCSRFAQRALHRLTFSFR